ncbi:tetratricopeptide repeat protein [Streptomyces echinatus]|uniref:tetratricopeptide repeat protein n=1 Tax=Streptomyces echinatus TaxID=67293 RepID=UPI001CEC4DA2|nr:tetratricopeptide repeat protein [Streptomyces echinatus]
MGAIPPRSSWFQVRAEADRLRSCLDDGSDTGVTGRVLSGLGGVGKTQLAADYARSALQAGKIDALVWVNATSRDAVLRAYADAGEVLCGADKRDLDRAAEMFLGWLEAAPVRPRCRWLVVLDDVADPDVLDQLWPPPHPHGRTLVTTRRRDAALVGDGRLRVDVGTFTSHEATSYLTKALDAPERPAQPVETGALARDLGFLPLALSQAAAYLVDTGQGIADYRALLADRTRTLADAAPERLPDGQGVAVAAAWSLSLERADCLRPAGLARPMLCMASMLDPNGIPQAVLTSASALEYLALTRTHESPDDEALTHAPPGACAAPTVQDAVLALRAAHRLSLLDHAPDDHVGTVRVHRLVQRATRDSLAADTRRQLARAAADALMDAWPESELDTRFVQSLCANTAALANLVEGADLYSGQVHRVLYRAGRSLGESGQFAAAVDHFRDLHEKAERHLGADHPDTLAARNNLASWRGEAGDAAGAAEAFAELVSDRRRVQGADHPDTLAARHNLAHCRGEAGDAAGAAEAFAELVSDRRRVQGADHPDTLAARHNLARWRGEAGHAAKAAAALTELVEIQLRVQGADHPNTLAVRHSLARWRGELGNAAGAAEALTKLLADQLRVQGADHPNTLAVRRSLARWRGELGDAAGAAEALTELLADQLRTQSPIHPNTLAVRHSLARWRGEAGDAAGAADAFAELVSDRRRVQGADHPDTLAARHNLAYWQGEAGDAAGAAEAFAELVSDRRRVQGTDHPDTLTTQGEVLAWAERAKGNGLPKVTYRSWLHRWAARLRRKRRARP